MEDIRFNELISSHIESDEKVRVHLPVDDVAVEDRLNIDFGQLPHQFIILCLHFDNTNFIEYTNTESV